MPKSKIPREEAERVVTELQRVLRFGGKKLPTVAVGSLRRKEATVGDLDIMVIAPKKAVEPLKRAAIAPRAKTELKMLESTSRGPLRHTFEMKGSNKKYKVDLFLASPAEKPYALLHHTGSLVYNTRVRAAAKRQGMRLNQYGLFVAGTDKRVSGSAKLKTEAAVQKFLGLTPRPPDDRK